MSREAFLKRVRAASQAGRSYRVQLRDIPRDAGYVGADGDLCQVMANEVDEVGGRALVVDGWPSARETFVQLLRELNVRAALCWQHPILDELGLDHVLASQNVTAYDHHALRSKPPSQQREMMLSADIGISSVDYAIAETGTLLVCSGPGRERVSTLLPPVHIAVVARHQIVADLLDAFATCPLDGSETLPSNVTLITGPSKTGDIELQLTTGVHGPGKWYVMIVR